MVSIISHLSQYLPCSQCPCRQQYIYLRKAKTSDIYLRKAKINKQFLALIVLDLGNLLVKYGIEGATLSSRGIKQVHLGTAPDNQVEQCSEVKVDCRRFVCQDKV